MLTAKEISKVLGVSVTTIYNWRNKDIITPSYISPTGRIFFDEDAVRHINLSNINNSNNKEVVSNG